MHPGLIGGLIGAALGILGGFIGTYFNIRNTKGPLERRFVIRCSCLIWLLTAAFITLALLSPGLILWAVIPYNLSLLVGLIQMNKKQTAIRAAEASTRI